MSQDNDEFAPQQNEPELKSSNSYPSQFVYQLIEDTKRKSVSEDEIEKDSKFELDHEQHYVEIINDAHGRVTTRLVDASVLTKEDRSSIIQADQIVGFDFMNFRVVRCSNDGTPEEIIENEGEMDVGEMMLQVNDGQQTHYINVANTVDAENIIPTIKEENVQNFEDNQYVQVVERDSVPLVFFQTDPPTSSQNIKIENETQPRHNMNISKKLAESPNFRQYLYPCKQCDFKCNAIKELTAHRLVSHPSYGSRFRAKPTPPPPKPVLNNTKLNCTKLNITQKVPTRHCPICGYSTISRHLFKRHLMKCHDVKKSQLESQDEDYKTRFKTYEYKQPSGSNPLTTTIFHCGTCGLSSNNSYLFKKHVCHSENRKNRNR